MTVTPQVTGQDLTLVDPRTPVQELLSFFIGDPCGYTGTDDFAPTPFGDPHTIGFWKHRVKVALSGKGKAQVDAATLAGYLPLDVFGVAVGDLAGLEAVRWIDNRAATLQDRAVQQCTGTLLNFESGQVGWLTPLDLDGGGMAETTFAAHWQSAAAAYAAGDFEAAKTACDDLNNL